MVGVPLRMRHSPAPTLSPWPPLSLRTGTNQPRDLTSAPSLPAPSRSERRQSTLSANGIAEKGATDTSWGGVPDCAVTVGTGDRPAFRRERVLAPRRPEFEASGRASPSAGGGQPPHFGSVPDAWMLPDAGRRPGGVRPPRGRAARPGAARTLQVDDLPRIRRHRRVGWGDGPRVSHGCGRNGLGGTIDLAGDPELVQLVTWKDFNEANCFAPDGAVRDERSGRGRDLVG